MKRFVDNLTGRVTNLVMIIAVIFLALPILVAIGMAFDSRPYLAAFPPPSLSLQWFERFFSDNYFLRGLKTSLLLASVVTVISTTIGTMAAVAIDRYRFKGAMMLATFFLSPLVVPGVVIGFALLMFLASLQFEGGFARLVAGHVIVTVPYTVRATLAGLVGIRASYTEAAMSLGANERQAFWDVTFPLARTGIVAGAIFAFAFSMDDVVISLFLSDPTTYTLPVALISMMRANFDLTIAAAAVLLIAMSVLLIVIVDRAVGLDKIIGQGIYRA